MTLRAFGFALIVFLLTWSRTFGEVTIAWFDAQAGTSQIKLVWTSAAERKNWGFNVERSIDQKNWQHLGDTPSMKSQSPCIQNVMGASYEFVDSSVIAGTKYFYRLQLYGQPCGDPNVYHEQIVSAMIAAPTLTPASTITVFSSPTVIAPTALPTRMPTKTITVRPTFPLTPTKQIPTKIALVPTRVTPSPIIQMVAPTPLTWVTPSPTVLHVALKEQVDFEEPISAKPSPIVTFIRIGVVLVASLFGLSSIMCAALALYLFVRSSSHR